MMETALEKLEAHLAKVENIYHKMPVSKVQTNPEYEAPELKIIKNNLKGSSARTSYKLKNINGTDKETRDQIIERVEKAYLKAVKGLNSTNR
jgi:hypothetical protein